jgi:hypothetical protein
MPFWQRIYGQKCELKGMPIGGEPAGITENEKTTDVKPWRYFL